MESMAEHRVNIRRKFKADVLLETFSTGIYYEGKMLNYSMGGMYFESDYAPLPGTEIYIGIESSPYDASADVYRAQVRWRKELSVEQSRFNFGVGVKYSQPIHSQL